MRADINDILPLHVPLRLDVTDPASITDAVEAASDDTVLINNAGITPATTSMLASSGSDLRATFEANFLGLVRLATAFAPLLAQHPAASALIDVHSIASWYAFAGSYSVSKAALWSATT